MSKLNYGRAVYVDARVKESEFWDKQNSIKLGPISYGYEGYAKEKLRLAELVMTSPQYFYKKYYSGALSRYDRWLEHEAWPIMQKAAHIVAPRARPKNWLFAMKFDSNGRFVNFKIIKKSDRHKMKPGILCVKHLDISLVSARGPGCDRAAERFVRRIHEEFFLDKTPTRWDYQEFFENPRNFDSQCREHHCPKILRLTRD